jgi:hypothetical protein
VRLASTLAIELPPRRCSHIEAAQRDALAGQHAVGG